MLKRQRCWTARAVVFSGLFLLAAGAAQAAGEWEWTKDLGWVQGAGTARPTPREQLQYAYELEQRGDFMDSARQYFLLVQAFPASQEAGVGLQRLARCLFEMENYYVSYQAIEQVLKDYPNTGRLQDLIEIELRIAKKMMVSDAPDVLGVQTGNRRDTNIRRALEIVDAVIEHDPYGPVAPEAYLVKGEGHLFVNEVQTARAAFEKLRDDFPKSEFIERARLGILTCDSLLGQASPQELQEQIELVREAERERLENRRPGDTDDVDNVENFIRKQNEVEAQKMLDQAEQYLVMGMPKTVKSGKFLCEEIIRRYPDTPQADIAMDRLGKARVPREPSRFAKILKGVNINPFIINKDPEPPWIVPQLSADDVVMVDQGIGPIAGVPESGIGPPPTNYAPDVRPTNLPEPGPDAGMNFSPAPEYFDATKATPGGPAGSAGAGRGGQPGADVPPSLAGGQPQRSAARNPLPGSESDLVGIRGNSQPTLGSPLWNTPDTDLVGPTPRADYLNPPIPEYGMSGDLVTMDPQPGSYGQSYQSPMYQEPAPGYAVPNTLQPGTQQSGGSANGGWTFGEEFR